MGKAKPANRFYRYAKISEYMFRRVLWGFACDLSVTEVARNTKLSTNSVSAIYQRLRAHYVRIGVFNSFYDNGDAIGVSETSDAYELALLEFHLKRISQMRGIPHSQNSSDHHFCESCWRFQLIPFFEGRSADAAHNMIFNELLTYLKVGGPVGVKAADLQAVRRCQLEFLNRRSAWLERSSPEFKSEDSRALLRDIRET
ncbi:hypothetical protein [Cohaesibacter gelatinilyticus]|uniref:Uncharacterized protein n=1 Tax=Cohaesibacter gelatinilyticus TaxID=372072 RepID=A0A285PHX1_9HYPH|nr:hypothetical protein [Cohaesibacter gelatinilyticus]SNZ21332.1 hypothetical protein SAMN06265368_4449 [Cohaesibacter gelatinilyticus]